MHETLELVYFDVGLWPLSAEQNVALKLRITILINFRIQTLAQNKICIVIAGLYFFPFHLQFSCR